MDESTIAARRFLPPRPLGLSKPRALVIGGSGQIGRFLVPQLLESGESGHAVLALSRIPRTSTRAGLEWLQGDVFSVMPALPALDLVFSLGPLNGFAEWLAVAKLLGKPRIVAFGSMSALSKRDSRDPGERALAETLRLGEQALAKSAASAGSAWTLLRPTLIYGAGLDRSLTPLARLGARWHVFPDLAGASGLRQPVHAEDLATVCRLAVGSDAAIGRSFDLGGGERLTFAKMLDRVRHSLTTWTLPVPVPLVALRFGLGMAKRSSRWPGFGPGIVDRLDRDLLADDEPARGLLGWSPRTFRPDASTWVPPPVS